MASLDMAPHDSLIELASLPMHLKSDSQLTSKWAIYMYMYMYTVVANT